MNDNDTQISHKFCRVVTHTPAEENECEKIMREIAETGDESKMEQLEKMTGLTFEQLLDKLTKSCPSCPPSY